MERLKYMPYKPIKSKRYWDAILGEIIQKNPIYDGNRGIIYNNLIRWVHGDPDFDFDLNKGIILAGPVGPGKSVAFEVLNKYLQIDNVKYKSGEKYIPLKFSIFNAKIISSEYAKNGYESLEKYILLNNICIDDVGTELTEVGHYSNKINCIAEIIERRYMNDRFTHFSTNLKLSEFKDFYGERAYSRLFDMCNYIEFIGDDLRQL